VLLTIVALRSRRQSDRDVRLDGSDGSGGSGATGQASTDAVARPA